MQHTHSAKTRLAAIAQAILLAAAIFALTPAANAHASAVPDSEAVKGAIQKAAAYTLQAVKNPEISSVGGEWAVIGLARSGYDVPSSYYSTYYANVEKYLRANGGVLHEKKYTEYSRVILGLTAAGYDPRNVAGYDLTAALADFDMTIWQGINGPVWALIALDSMAYPIPQGTKVATQASRELYVGEILRRQLPGGGWNLTAGSGGEPVGNEEADPDITGMALQALAKYRATPGVSEAIDKALARLSLMQDEKGGYKSWGNVNSESVVQVLVALCELGIPTDDARFVKNGSSLVDNILSFMNADGSFRHMADGAGNSQMSTEQALYGLVAAQRAHSGANGIYSMSDAAKRGDHAVAPPHAGAGLPGKHHDVKHVPAAAPKTFADISGHSSKAEIEALAARGIINGKDSTSFEPDATMTRAEFAAIVTRALGLSDMASGAFADVPAGAWYAGSVGSAHHYGIVNGVSASEFLPSGTITRQEAAVMAARAAKLAGLDTGLDATSIRDALAQFGDYTATADWAREPLAFCYGSGIMDSSEFYIRPGDAIKRCEIAEILYRTLEAAALL